MSLGNSNHPRSSEQDHITEALQYYNSLYNKLHQSKSAEVLRNISLQTIYFKPYKP
jgi:ABC-type dipeptide/oligopeptide/nickel transport system ATPase subunit